MSKEFYDKVDNFDNNICFSISNTKNICILDSEIYLIDTLDNNELDVSFQTEFPNKVSKLERKNIHYDDVSKLLIIAYPKISSVPIDEIWICSIVDNIWNVYQIDEPGRNDFLVYTHNSKLHILGGYDKRNKVIQDELLIYDIVNRTGTNLPLLNKVIVPILANNYTVGKFKSTGSLFISAWDLCKNDIAKKAYFLNEEDLSWTVRKYVPLV